MKELDLAKKKRFVWDSGYKIYPKVSGYGHYRLVIAKETKYNWGDIPREKRSKYEQVDGIIYSLKVGDELYKIKPAGSQEKWWDKINELYVQLYDRLTSKIAQAAELKR